MTYAITFTCSGCRLHGDEYGSVDVSHNALPTLAPNLPGSPALDEDPARAAFEELRMDQPAYDPDQIRRDTVLNAIREVCTYIRWW